MRNEWEAEQKLRKKNEIPRTCQETNPTLGHPVHSLITTPTELCAETYSRLQHFRLLLHKTQKQPSMHTLQARDVLCG